MALQLQETAGNAPVDINIERKSESSQSLWTLKGLGIELQEAPEFSKSDFEKALKKVTRKVKK